MSFVSAMRNPPVSRASVPRPVAGSKRRTSSVRSIIRVKGVLSPETASFEEAEAIMSAVPASSRRVSSAPLLIRSPAASAA